MLDLSYFKTQNSDVQGFFSGGTWQTWIKPRGAKLVNIMCVGSGGGGGGGFQSITTPRSGASGGGSGAAARLTINANLLPDILYILPGMGGAGGLGGDPATAGSPGQNSFVTLIPSTASSSTIVLRSGTTVASAGGGGSTVAPAAAQGETINVVANNIFANLGIFTYQGGVGANTPNIGASASTTPANFIVGAGGGGGIGTAGGVAGLATFLVIPTIPLNTDGQNGPIVYNPTLLLYGGRGGGGAVTGNGGNGGNGAPGAGGGGGGASANTGVNAGNGGRGGNGFIIITTSL